MHRLLGGALAQLEHRCDDVMDAVRGCSELRLEWQRQRVVETVEDVRRKIEASRSTAPEIDPDPNGGGNPFWLYRVGQLSKDLQAVERAVVPPLLRFDDRDMQITRIAERLLHDSGWTRPIPLVTAFSTHFQSDPAYQVIAAPAGEERRLLRLPDLCHEIGHCLCHQANTGLMSGELQDQVVTLTAAQSKRHKQEGDKRLALLYDHAWIFWQSFWLEEFCCDVVATYLTGASYALQHFSLTVVLGRNDPHFHAITHPSDAARWLVIERTLRRLGLDKAADDLQTRWKGLLTVRERQPQHKDFGHWYPDQLLDATIDQTIAACRGIGLRAFDPNADPEVNLPRLIDDAWQRFLDDPERYNGWEAAQIASLVSRL